MDSSSPITDKYWADSPGHYDRNLNFVALANDIEEEEEYGCSKKKTVRDPMSHRIIEKRRRDRMNNCLADLSRLLPAAYLKKGRGRIEKTEIIEMAIKHMRHLQIHACQQMETCEIASNIERQNNSTDQQYRLGYSECMSEMMHFLVEVEGFFAGDALCSRLMNHLQMHGEKISRGGSGFPHAGARSSSSSSGSSSADFHRNGTSSSGSSADNSQFMPRSSTSSSNCSSKSTKHQLSELDDKETRVKVEENESSASSKSYRLPSHMAGIDSEDMDRSSQCPTNPSSTAPSENNNQDSSDSGTNMHQKDLKDMLLSDSGFTSTGTSHSSSSRLDETGFYKKYKTDIQQRFTAEEHHGQEELDEPSDLDSSKRRKVAYKASSTHESNKYDFKTPIGCADSLVPPKDPRLATRQKSPIHFVYQNEPKAPPLDNFLTASPATHSPQCETVSSIDANNLAPSSKPDNLPVFVLHPQGSFYIPTLIEASVVTPLLTEYVQAPVLHPVTIHVSFGHSTKVIGAKMEPHSFPSSTPVADPSVGSENSKGLLAVDRRGRLSPYEKRKSPHDLVAPSPAPLDASSNENTNNNNVRRWMEERVPMYTREYGSEDLRLPLNEGTSRSNAIFGSVGQSPRRGQATTGDIKELTAHSLLELSTQTSKDNYINNRHSSAVENTNYSFPVQETSVPVHPFPSRDCEVLREVPSSNSARWSYLMGSAKRL